MIYLGIDPGASGGLAAVGTVQQAKAMPPTARDIWEWISRFSGNETFAVIEKNSGFVGGRGNPGSGMYKFGQNAGMLRGFLIAANIPYEEITPGVWQRSLGIPGRKKNESKTQYKNRLKSHAQSLFPSEQVTLKTADALLISEYCRRKRGGTL